MPGSLVAGLAAVAGSGIANGSFAVPEKRIRHWRWEHVWLVYSLCALSIIPLAITVLSAPAILTQVLPQHLFLTGKVFACGLMFGAGSVLFGLSLARLGIAVTNALVSGVVVFLGSVGPLAIGAAHIDLIHFIWLLIGLATLLASLALCALASLLRERSVVPTPASDPSRSRLGGAIVLAVVAGALSSMLNIGFAYGEPLVREAALRGSPALVASMAVWIPALLGGVTFNAGYPVYLIVRGRSWQTFLARSSFTPNVLLASAMGALWFGSNLLYGYGALRMGEDGAVYGWALSSGASILVSNTWGVATGEWRGCQVGAKRLMWLSTLLLILSFIILIVKRMPS